MKDSYNPKTESIVIVAIFPSLRDTVRTEAVGSIYRITLTFPDSGSTALQSKYACVHDAVSRKREFTSRKLGIAVGVSLASIWILDQLTDLSAFALTRLR